MLGARARQRARAAPRCRDALGGRRCRGSRRARRSGPHTSTATRSTSRATTPRSWVTQTTAIPVSACSVSTRSRICCWIVTSSAVVGSSAISTRGEVESAHRDHHPLQHPARELVRIGALDPLGVGQPDLAEHLAGAGGRVRRRRRRAPRSVSSICERDPEQRVERAHRILVDHRDLAAAHLAQPLGADAEQVLAREVDLAADESGAARAGAAAPRASSASCPSRSPRRCRASRPATTSRSTPRISSTVAACAASGRPEGRGSRGRRARSRRSGVRTTSRSAGCGAARSGEAASCPGTTAPRIDACRAPVHDGTVAGRPCTVRKPMSANTKRLLGRLGDAEDVEGLDRHAGKPPRELGHQRRVAGAAAGGDHVGDAELLQVGGDRLGRERGQRGEQVVGRDRVAVEPSRARRRGGRAPCRSTSAAAAA